MSKAPSLSQKVANIQHMPVLIAATSASKDPADGFIVKDIVKMTYESTQTRVFLQQYLLNQLCATNNVFVKIRVLNLFIILLEEGHIEFKQNLRKQPEAFNEASKLRPHQPKNVNLVGECGRIRDMASKILDMLFEDTPELRRKPPPYVQTNALGDDGSSSRLTGFGNTSYKPPSNQGTTTGKIKKMFGVGHTKESKAIVYDPNYATLDPVPHNQTASSPFTPQIGLTLGSRYSEDVPSGKGYVPGKAGGGWDEPVSTSNPSPSATYRTEQVQEEEPQNGHQDLADVEATSTEQERRLVEEITAPGGIKVAPPRELLTVFVTRCRTLDSLAVVEYLRMKLQSEESRVILRALFVVDTLSRSDLPDILSHLDLVLEELSNLSQSQHTTVKTKANKILMQLTAQNAQQVTKSSNQVESGDILNMRDVGTREEQTETAGPVMTAEQADFAASLFTGMSVSGEKSTRPRARKPVQPVKKPVKQEHHQPTSSYEDLLGLNDPPQSQPDHTPSQSHPPITQQEPELGPEDDSLLTFGSDEEEFDPLKRSDSINNSLVSKRTNSFTASQTGSIPGLVTMTTNNPSDVPGLVAMTASNPSNNQGGMPNTLEPSGIVGNTPVGLLGDLAGIDMGKTSPLATPPLTHRELPILQQLQPNMPTSATVTSSTIVPLTTGGVATASMGSYPAQGAMMTHGGVVYAPVAQPYGVGMPQGGGAMVQHVPMMYMPVGGQRMPYANQPSLVLGGAARPVQRAAPSVDTPTNDSGFSFLDKTSKGSAFDFVQDEMRASQTTK